MAKVKVEWSEEVSYAAVVDVEVDDITRMPDGEAVDLLTEAIVKLSDVEMAAAFSAVRNRDVEFWQQVETDKVPNVKAPQYEPEWDD